MVIFGPFLYFLGNFFVFSGPDPGRGILHFFRIFFGFSGFRGFCNLCQARRVATLKLFFSCSLGGGGGGRYFSVPSVDPEVLRSDGGQARQGPQGKSEASLFLSFNIGASQMTTKFLTIKFANFQFLLSWNLPGKIGFLGAFSVNFPLPSPLQNANFTNIVILASVF